MIWGVQDKKGHHNDIMNNNFKKLNKFVKKSKNPK